MLPEAGSVPCLSLLAHQRRLPRLSPYSSARLPHMPTSGGGSTSPSQRPAAGAERRPTAPLPASRVCAGCRGRRTTPRCSSTSAGLAAWTRRRSCGRSTRARAAALASSPSAAQVGAGSLAPQCCCLPLVLPSTRFSPGPHSTLIKIYCTPCLASPQVTRSRPSTPSTASTAASARPSLRCPRERLGRLAPPASLWPASPPPSRTPSSAPILSRQAAAGGGRAGWTGGAGQGGQRGARGLAEQAAPPPCFTHSADRWTVLAAAPVLTLRATTLPPRPHLFHSVWRVPGLLHAQGPLQAGPPRHRLCHIRFTRVG